MPLFLLTAPLVIGTKRTAKINKYIVSKLSIKGDATDIVDNFLLTTSGTAFFYYGYDPASKIRIYEITKKD